MEKEKPKVDVKAAKDKLKTRVNKVKNNTDVLK